MSSKVGKGAEKARITPTEITSAYNSQALQETTHIKMEKKNENESTATGRLNLVQ